MTLACTRCGEWHLSAERTLGRNLSCTEVKRFWNRIKNQHQDTYDHAAHIVMDATGTPFCFTCKQPVDLRNGSV